MKFDRKLLGGLFRTIFTTSLLCMLIPLIIVSFIAVRALSSNLSATANKNLEQLSIEKMNEVNSMIKSQVALTKAVAQSSYIQNCVFEGEDAGIIIDYLGSISSNSKGLYENFFITRQSAGFADCLGGKTLHDVAGEPWYEECKKSGEFLGNNISPVTGRPVYVISYGIYCDGKFAGGLNNSIDLATMTQEITGSITDGKTKALIIDREGFVIASADSEQILKTNFNQVNESTAKLMTSMLKNQSGRVEFEYDGEVNVGYFATVDKMITLVYMPESEYTKLISSVIYRIFNWFVLCILIVTVIIFTISLSISKPISIVDASIHGIAQGDADLTKRLDVNAKYEVRSLVDGFNSFSDKMQNMISEIKDSQSDLKSAGDALKESTFDTESSITEILANIKSVNDRINHQSGVLDSTENALDDISTSLNELHVMIGDQSTNVDTASSQIEEVLANIDTVNTLTTTMASDFAELEKNVSVGMTKQIDVVNLVQKIEEQSKTLQDANTVINNIAAQTNLLAMNAAIEAAHAGESGKGFSVVADEIRKLSLNSTQQSQKIGEQLSLITQSIGEVVGASNASKQSFEVISGKLGETDTTVKRITSAMLEQQAESKQIGDSLKNVTESTGKVLSSSKEIASSSTQILSKLQMLQNSSDEMKESMGEMTIGAEKINKTGVNLSEISKRVEESIQKNSVQIGRFKV